ncbi:MAG TPA: hypothetical protein VLJ68_11450, partial [Chitinophagaceae bacterium]|nr:hypothetical protein [Chitinophagaceae bacterium]
MTRGQWIFIVFFLFCSLAGTSQKILYSEPEKDDTRRIDFEVAGKIGGNFLVYKSIRNRNWIAVLDNDMNQVGREDLDFIPDNDRVINIEFFPYSDFCYMIYQYQKKSIVHCMAAKLDANGKKTGEVIELDTTHIGFSANNKIYTVLASEDKSRMIVFKINSRNKKMYALTTILMNDKLETLKKSQFFIKMDDRNEFLNEFHLDNDGDLVFARFYRNNNDNISEAEFILKNAMSDTVVTQELQIEKSWLDEIHIKVDNFNKRYFLSSFFYKQKKGNIDGLYFYIWDKATGQPLLEKTAIFSEELRKDARAGSNIKSAFNDFFIRNIIVRRDGGFIVGSEAYYTTSRFNNWNRWDYLYGSRYNSPLDNYYYSPVYSNYLWNSRWNTNQSVRYHADNITVMSFSKEGEIEWSNILGKEQYDDESDDLISYQVMNTGGQLHFLFNQMERRNNLLNDYSVAPDGKLNHNPTLKNLDKGYEFMPKYAKQVSARQMIIPCLHRNY